MNSVLLSNIRKTYGETIANEVDTEIEKEPSQEHVLSRVLAKVLGRHQKMDDATSAPMGSVPVPTDFDLNTQETP